MWRALLAALLLAGCAPGGPPAPIASPPPEIAVIALDGFEGGAHSIVETRTGRLITNLAPGTVTIGLSGGADIAEAYLVTPSQEGTAIDAIVPSKDYGQVELASQPGRAVTAVLASAPGLTSFVGRQTVLTVLDTAGGLTGYQHGTRLWTASLAGQKSELLQVGSKVVAGSGGDWRQLDLRTGKLGASLAGTPCLPGPVAEVAGRLVLQCGGRLEPYGETVLNARPVTLASGGAVLLAFPDGAIWRLSGPGAREVGKGPRWMVAPVASPDGSSVYVATDAGIEKVTPAGGASHRLVALPAITSLAVSRDGNFVYALAGGRLRTFTSTGGARAGDVAVNGRTIQLIAGG